MNSPSSRSALLALALLWTTGASVFTEKSGSDAHHMTVSVGVPLICTVMVTPGEWSADEAVDVQCRNLPDGHPEPQISETATASSEEWAVTSDGDAATMVEINF